MSVLPLPGDRHIVRALVDGAVILVREVGFPALVAFYLLFRLDGQVVAVLASMRGLASDVERLVALQDMRAADAGCPPRRPPPPLRGADPMSVAR